MSAPREDQEPIHTSLMINAVDVGKLLGVSKNTIWKWESSGRLPEPVRIGGITRWRADEIKAWVEARCPPREKWELIYQKGT